MLRNRDLRTIQNRAEAVVTLLRNPVFYCGMGLPVAPNEYRAAFGGSVYASYYWNGPISAVKSPTGKAGGELRLVYAKPAYVKLTSDLKYPDDGNKLYFNGAVGVDTLASRSSGPPETLRECVIFKNSFPRVNPLIVRWVTGTRKSVEVESLINPEFKLYKGDMLHLLYVYRIFARNGILYTQDYRMSGEQPRVDGISDIRFDADAERRTLTVYALIRGDRAYVDRPAVDGAETWPEKFSDGEVYKQSNYRRRLFVFTLGLPNYMKEEVFKGKCVRDLSQ
ncbi:MAG: hypothetical protein Q4F74_05515 [Synergistaceae bacterium]|nr:hypothetical protein [Synergistaceae bacterium]